MLVKVKTLTTRASCIGWQCRTLPLVERILLVRDCRQRHSVGGSQALSVNSVGIFGHRKILHQEAGLDLSCFLFSSWYEQIIFDNDMLIRA